MKTFIDFARAHGIVIDALPTEIGVWKRYPTTDKPHKRNGSVKYMGSHGYVQNYGTMHGVSEWHNEGESPIAAQDIQRIANQAAQEILQANEKAASKAEWILDQTKLKKHAYINSKGFVNEAVNVWETDTGPVAVIPMWHDQRIVGCQLIAESGDKKFLFGQRSSEAQFIFDNQGGEHFLCEGYATGLSVRSALDALKRPYVIHVCFSAGNMIKVGAKLPGGVVVADNDPQGAGERAARQIGWPYWMSDVVGEDFNDLHQRVGVIAASQSLLSRIVTPSLTEQKQLDNQASAKPLLHVGSIGQKVATALTVDWVHAYDSAYGTQYRINLLDDQGNKLTWKTATPPADLLGSTAKGQTFLAEFKIKSHDEYKEEPQTAVSHLKFKGWVQRYVAVLSITDTSTAAFEDIGRNQEAARIVRDAAASIAQGWNGNAFDLKDTNGNTVGTFEAVEGQSTREIAQGEIRLTIAANLRAENLMKAVADKLKTLGGEGVEMFRDTKGNVIASITVMPALPRTEPKNQLTEAECDL
jgi:hypothetical protein